MNQFSGSRSIRARTRPITQRGMTLIELMIAMTLALAIVAAVSYVYIQGKTGFMVSDSRARLQENARLAFSLVSRDIMSGGYFGCFKPRINTLSGTPFSSIYLTAAQPVMTSNTSWLELDGDQTNASRQIDPGLAIRGYDDGGGWPVSPTLSAKRFAGTDTLVILKGGEDARHLVSAPTDDDTIINVTSPMTGVTQNNEAPLMVISNCTTGEIIKPTIRLGGTRFVVDNTLNENENGTKDAFVGKLHFGQDYGVASMLTTFEPVTYYVAESKGKDGVLVPSLHRLGVQRSRASANNGLWATSGGSVVVEGIERLQIRYFIQGASEGTSNGPLTAAAVTAASAWRSLVAVQVEFTVVSDDDGLRTATTTQTVGGNSVTDRKLRLTSSFTVNVRVPKD